MPMFPSWVANRCIVAEGTGPGNRIGRLSGRIPRIQNAIDIKDLNERYLAWYGHYVKGDGTPARPKEETSLTGREKVRQQS